jgi:hypothetical protein
MFSNIKASMITSGVVMILLFFILMVSRIMVTYQVPQHLTELMLRLTTNKWLVLMMINIILLLMGMLVDEVSGNILSAAILLPVAKSVGIGSDSLCGHFRDQPVTWQHHAALRSHALSGRSDRGQTSPERICQTRVLFHYFRGITHNFAGDLHA